MSVRALWVFLAPKKATGSEQGFKVLFSRRFPLVERRQKQFASKHECEHFPIPSDKDVLVAVAKQACSDESKVCCMLRAGHIKFAICNINIAHTIDIRPYLCTHGHTCALPCIENDTPVNENMIGKEIHAFCWHVHGRG